MSFDVARRPRPSRAAPASVGLLAAALALLTVGAVTISAGVGEYPIWSRPGARFLFFEAGPPLLAGIVALTGWPRGKVAPGRPLRLAALAVLATLLVRTGARVIRGTGPLGFIEAILLALAVVLALWLEVAAARTPLAE